MKNVDTISGVSPEDSDSQGVELAYDPIQAGLRSASRMRIGASDDEYRAAAKRVGDALFTLAKLKDFKPNGEEQYRAAAMKAAKAMSGYADYDGRIFNGGKPFESGEAYWRKVRGILIDGGKSGLSEDYQRFYDEKDPEKRMQMADAALGFKDALIQFGGDAARAFAGSSPLHPNELQGAPEDVRAASDLLSRYESERPAITSQSVTGVTTVYGPRKSDAESVAAEQKVGAWRRQRQRQENLAKYEWQLLQENRWAALMSVLPSLKEPEAEECARAIMDSKDGKLPVEMSAKFSALSPRSQEALVQIRQLSRERIEGGFWNTIGDMGIGLANTTLMMARGVGQQLIKYGRGWNEPLSREEEAYATQEVRNASAVIENYNRGGTNIPEDRLEWARKTVGDFRKKDLGGVGVDVNQLAQRQQRLWQVTGDFFAGTGKGQLPMMQFEQLSEEHGFVAEALIGAVSTLPYMGAAMIPYAGPAIVALSAMQEFDDHVAANGGDITDPAYIASSFVLGGIYSYVERLQIDRLIGGVSEQAVREGLLKGFWSGVKNMTVPRVLFVQTLSESLQEGLQNGIAGVNEALGLGDDPVRAFGEGFVEDFVGSLGTMAVIGAGGTVVGHMNRSGWHVRGKSGVSAAELRHMERSTDLEGIVRSHRAENEMVELDARSLDFMAKREKKILGDLFPIWENGGAKALEKFGLTPEHARQADEYFKAERAANGADGKTAASALEESGADYDAPADYDAAFQVGEIDRDSYEVLLQGIGFTVEGARDYATFIQYKRTVYERLVQLQGFLDERYRAEGERGMSADLDRVRGALRANERIRNVWAQGAGVVQKRVDDKGNVVIVSDPGAAALEKFGFTKKDAERLSRMFHYERAVAHSRVALDGIRALYDRSTRGKVSPKAAIASEFGGRVIHDNGTDYITFEDEGVNYAVEIREIGGGGAIDTKSNAPGIARDVEIKTNGKVTAKQWLDATPEQRKQWAKLFYDEGHFAPMNPSEIILSPAGDPGASVDSSGARTILFGRINLQAQSGLTKVRDLEDDQMKQIVDSGAGFHEVYHAWSRFMKVTGKWTEKDVAELAKKYGEGDPTLGENHDEEVAADALRAYVTRRMEGSLTAEDEKSPFVKIWSLAKKLVRHSDEKLVKARAATTAEEAFFDQILADRFVGVGDLSGTPASSPESSAKPQTSAPTYPPSEASSVAGAMRGAPQMPGRTDKGADKGATEPEKKPEPADKPAEPEKPKATPKPAAQRGWTAYTPTGNVKVGGHYAVVNLSEVIHSNNPAYALYMRAQLRNRKDNKAEEDTRKDIVNNFQGERLLEAPDTANGAPIVFIAPDEKGVKRMFVLSGNGRILVLNELAERHMYDKYRNVMKAWAAENGLEVPEGETPVLVRVIDDYGGATREKVADLSNTNSIQQYTEEEQARADAEIIKSLGIARLYHANVNGSPDMTPGVNDDFFAEFIRGVGDTSLYNSDRSLTETARIRAVRALLAITVGQGERGRDVVKKLIEQTDTLNIVRQKNAAAIMAAAVAGLETNDAYSIGPDVSRAMADYIDFAEKKKAGKVGTFDEYFAQMDLLDGPSEIAREILKLFGSKQSASNIAEYVNKYCEAAAQSDPTGGLFGEAGVRTRIQIWNDAVKAVDEARSKGVERHSIATLEDPGITKPYDPITKKEMDLIATEIGTTDDPADVGFILPDGRLVKYLSHIACVQPVIFSRGIRYSEHSGYRMVGTALKSGMVRTGGLSRAWIQLGAKPSQKQRDAIRDYMEAQRKSSHYSDFTIEVEGEDNVFHSATYSLKVSPSRIFDDIDNFYDNGIEPQGQSFLSQFFHWSIATYDFEAMNRYYDGDVRSIARMLKAGDDTAIAMAAGAMARAIKQGDVLIPVPSHDGRAHDTLLLADAISRITGSPVVEAIRGTVRDSIYDMKAKGYLPDAEDLGFYRAADIPEDRRAVFIDNVVGTGTTAVAARQALGRGHIVAFAWDHTAPHPVGIVGGLAERHSITAEEDAAHADAIKRGDIKTAARLVREAAEKSGYVTDSSYQGTSAFNGAAPSANGYYANKEERKAAWEDGSFEGETTFGDYIFDGIGTPSKTRLN